MPRDYSTGIFTLVASYKAISGQTIKAEQHNPPLEDIATGLSNSLPRIGAVPMLANLNMGGFAVINLAPPTSSNGAARLADVQAAMPIGTVVSYALANPPAGWIFCDGSILLPATTYPALRQALLDSSSPYGTDSGNPRIPDCRGRVDAGRDNMSGTAAGRLTGQAGGVAGSTLGGEGGAETHTLTLEQAPAHQHYFNVSTSTDGWHNHTIPNAGWLTAGGSFSDRITAGGGGVQTDYNGSHYHNVQGYTEWKGGNAAHNNVQPTIVFNKIIRAL